MSAADRPCRFSRAVTVLAPSLSALCGCAIALLPLLAAAPAARAAPCVPSAAGVATQGCTVGGTGATTPGPARSQNKPAPGTPTTQVAPCAQGSVGAVGCNAGATRAMLPQLPNAMQKLSMGTRGILPDPCAPGVHREGMPGCNAGGAGAVVQGVMTFMQMMVPVVARPH
jgi:hypothetical protein